MKKWYGLLWSISCVEQDGQKSTSMDQVSVYSKSMVTMVTLSIIGFIVTFGLFYELYRKTKLVKSEDFPSLSNLLQHKQTLASKSKGNTVCNRYHSY